MAVSLVALPLPQAMAWIDAADETLVGVVVTAPPAAGRGEGVPRVVRERRTPDGIELTIAFPVPPAARGGAA